MKKNACDRFADVNEILVALIDFSTEETLSAIGNPIENRDNQRSLDPTTNSSSLLKGKPTYSIAAYLIAAALIIPIVVLVFLSVSNRVEKPNEQPRPTTKSRKRFAEKLPAIELSKTLKGTWLRETTPITKIKTVNGKRYREFYFPTDVSIGLVLIDIKTVRKAMGTIVFPAVPARFAASDSLGDFPKFFDRFDDQALCALTIKVSKSPPAIATLRKWKHLSLLDYADCFLSDSYVRDLGQLAHLNDLTFSSSRFSPEALAASGVLPKLVRFSVSKLRSCTKILREFKNSNKLNYMGLKATTLSAEDFDLTAAIPNLLTLDLRQSRFKEGDLQAITRSKKLTTLDLQSTNQYYSIKTLEMLVAKMPNLRLLRVSPKTLTDDDIQRLKQANGSLNVEMPE